MGTRPSTRPRQGAVLAAVLAAAGWPFAIHSLHAESGRLATTPAWTAEGDVVVAIMGFAVAGAGDVDGDGYDDLAVGLPGASYSCGPSACQEGAVYVYEGGAAGPRSIPDWLVIGPAQRDGYGTGVGGAGDVNGDGFADLIFSGSFESDVPHRVLVYHGSSSGLASTPRRTYTLGSGMTVWPLPATGAGDVNRDGYDDVIVGWRLWNAGAGRALVFRGSAAGLSANASWSVEGGPGVRSLGFTVASAGDVNRDGYGDVIVGSDVEARVYLGSAAGISTTPAWSAPMQAAVSSSQANSYGEVASAGDANRDGYDDVVVGSPRYTNGQSLEGRAELYLGSAGGLAPTPAWSVESDKSFAYFGCSLSRAGDVNLDGYSDVIVGACFEGGGRAYVFHGTPSGLSAAPAWTASGDGEFGRSVRAAGDVNGDGRPDVIVGAPGFNSYIGKVFLYLGIPPESSGPAAAAPDGSSAAPGVPLGVTKNPGGSLTLTWGVSCLGTEMDWEVYQGVLGEDFSSHEPRLCSMGGQRAAMLVPPDGDVYYLVVPRTLDAEGSYGVDGEGAERPLGPTACLPRLIAACP